MNRFIDDNEIRITGVYSGEKIRFNEVIFYVFNQIQDIDSEKMIKSRILVNFIYGEMKGIEELKGKRIGIKGICLNDNSQVILLNSDFQ